MDRGSWTGSGQVWSIITTIVRQRRMRNGAGAAGCGGQ